MQYEAPIQTVRAVRGRVLEPSVLVETLIEVDILLAEYLRLGNVPVIFINRFRCGIVRIVRRRYGRREMFVKPLRRTGRLF